MIQEILKELGPLGQILGAAENIRLVVKDSDHRYLYANQGWLDSVDVQSEDLVLGKTVYDIFPRWRADRYHAEELEVLTRGLTIDTCEELILLEGSEVQLWRSIKAPRLNGAGEICGMVMIGILIDPEMLRRRLQDERPSAIDWMERNACETLTMDEVARRLNLSRRALERYFRDKTGDSPANYRLKCRLTRACQMLRNSDRTIASIAQDCGFHDQSHFAKAFRRNYEQSPGAWREANA